MNEDDLTLISNKTRKFSNTPTRAWSVSSSVRERRLTSGKLTDPRVTPWLM